jgi:hypothetical protein
LRTSGARSPPLGQVIVPVSGSTRTSTKQLGPRNDSNTPSTVAKVGEVDVADQAVREHQAQPIMAENLHFGDVMERRKHVWTVPLTLPDQIRYPGSRAGY